MRQVFEATGKFVDDLNVDTRSPEERLIYGMQRDIMKMKTSVGNVQAIVLKTTRARNGLLVGSPTGGGGNGTFLPVDPSVFTGFLSLQPLSFLGYLKESVLSSTFQMNLSVSWINGNFSGVTKPSVDVSVPCYFNLTAWNSNYDSEYPTGLSPYKRYSTYLSINVGNLIFNSTNGTFKFVPFKKSYNLLDIIQYRPYDETDGNNLTYDPNKIDYVQLNNILDNGQNFFYGVFYDQTGLSSSDKTIMQNLYNNIFFDTELTFLYNGIQLAKI